MKNKGVLPAIGFAMAQVKTVSKVHSLVLLAEIIRKVGFSLLMIWLPQQIVQAVSTQQLELALLSILALCLLMLCNDIMVAYVSKTFQKLKVKLKNRLNQKLATVMMEVEYRRLETKEFLDLINFSKRCMEQDSVMKVSTALLEMLAGMLTIGGIFYLLLSMQLWIFGIILISVIINVVGELIRMNYIYDRERKSGEVDRNLYYARDDLATNIFAKDIRLYHLHDFVSKKLSTYADLLCQLWSKTAMKSVKIIGWTYVANGLQLIAIYALIAYECYSGSITVSEFVLYTSGMVGFSLALKDIFTAVGAVAIQGKYIHSMEHLFQSVEGEEKKDRTDLSFQQNIEFVSVSFQYEGAKDLTIKDLSLSIEKGKRYAIVGRNGAGKTTFIKLLLGLYQPTKGEILVDGKALRDLNKEEYWNLFSCVFQDFKLFAYSIKENIIFDQKVGKEVIDALIEKVGLDKKINALPEKTESKLNRELHADGVMFSGGEQQLLAIARSIHKQADVYILDEPSSALSPQSEVNLYREFDSFTKGKTVVFISHRLASCRLCDEIIVLEQGSLHEQGSHQDLMERKDLYFQMFTAQSKPYSEEGGRELQA